MLYDAPLNPQPHPDPVGVKNFEVPPFHKFWNLKNASKFPEIKSVFQNIKGQHSFDMLHGDVAFNMFLGVILGGRR